MVVQVAMDECDGGSEKNEGTRLPTTPENGVMRVLDAPEARRRRPQSVLELLAV